jgi:hypothetical protein
VLPYNNAVIFDSEQLDSRIPNLESREYGLPRWSGGNLAGVQLDNMLMLQGCPDAQCDAKLGDKRQTTGTILFDFDVPITSFGFALINVDEAFAQNGAVKFVDIYGARVIIPDTTVLAGYQIGDNTANQIAPYTAQALGLGPIKSVYFFMGGPGAIDNINYTQDIVPEPATGLFLGLGLALLAGVRRNRAA